MLIKKFRTLLITLAFLNPITSAAQVEILEIFISCDLGPTMLSPDVIHGVSDCYGHVRGAISDIQIREQFQYSDTRHYYEDFAKEFARERHRTAPFREISLRIGGRLFRGYQGLPSSSVIRLHSWDAGEDGFSLLLGPKFSSKIKDCTSFEAALKKFFSFHNNQSVANFTSPISDPQLLAEGGQILKRVTVNLGVEEALKKAAAELKENMYPHVKDEETQLLCARTDGERLYMLSYDEKDKMIALHAYRRFPGGQIFCDVSIEKKLQEQWLMNSAKNSLTKMIDPVEFLSDSLCLELSNSFDSGGHMAPILFRVLP